MGNEGIRGSYRKLEGSEESGKLMRKKLGEGEKAQVEV